VPRSRGFFLWNVASNAVRGVGGVVAAILLIRNNDNNNNPTTIVVPATQGQTPAP